MRCVAPDVGGGFGVKGHVYPEDVLIAYLARKRLGRPVAGSRTARRIISTPRIRATTSTTSEIGFDDEGRILALRDVFVKDFGAYHAGRDRLAVEHDRRILWAPTGSRNLDAAATIVVTNKTPNAPYRGVGTTGGRRS